LLLDCLRYLGAVVAADSSQQRRKGVEVAPAVNVIDVAPLAPGEDLRAFGELGVAGEVGNDVDQRITPQFILL